MNKKKSEDNRKIHAVHRWSPKTTSKSKSDELCFWTASITAPYCQIINVQTGKLADALSLFYRVRDALLVIVMHLHFWCFWNFMKLVNVQIIFLNLLLYVLEDLYWIILLLSELEYNFYSGMSSNMQGKKILNGWIWWSTHESGLWFTRFNVLTLWYKCLSIPLTTTP